MCLGNGDINPQPAQQQEPVGEAEPYAGRSADHTQCIFHRDSVPVGTKLYTSPPAQRTWVGLTDEDMDALRLATGYAAGLERFTVIARAIEAKLKEKNT